jgi:hypothetical protein
MKELAELLGSGPARNRGVVIARHPSFVLAALDAFVAAAWIGTDRKGSARHEGAIRETQL